MQIVVTKTVGVAVRRVNEAVLQKCMYRAAVLRKLQGSGDTVDNRGQQRSYCSGQYVAD
jgi:hypothetical protein